VATATKAAAKKTAAKKTTRPGARTNAYELGQYRDKEPTQLHRDFVAWSKAKTGLDLDLKTVQVAFSLRMPFQRSEENQADLAERKAAAEAKVAAREQRATDRAAKKAAPPAAKKTAAKKVATKKTAQKSTPAKATAKRRATKVASSSGGDDF
jgi:hypothetical protein